MDTLLTFHDVLNIMDIIKDHLLKFIQKIKEEIEDEKKDDLELKEKLKNIKKELILEKFGYRLHNLKK